MDKHTPHVTHDGPIKPWLDRLKSCSDRGLEQLTGGLGHLDAAAFRDEMGNHRAIDEPLVRWCQNQRACPDTQLKKIDEQLWWALVGNDLVGLEDALSDPVAALTDQQHLGQEIRTEQQLTGLHALWHIAQLTNNAQLRAACSKLVAWHLEHTQPDNATNHPWAIHVFVLESARSNMPDAEMFAATQLSNCQVQLGRSDLRSALILLDAARAIQSTLE